MYILSNKEAFNNFRDSAQANYTENKEIINSENLENENSLRIISGKNYRNNSIYKNF